MELRTTALCCRVGAFTLGPVELCVPAGSSLALVGPNGSGKSTLLNALCGLNQVHSGAVLLDGQPLGQLGARQRARAICLLPQQEAGSAAFTVEDYVLLGRHAHLGLLEPYRAQDQAQARWAMELTGCATWRERLMHTLSGGERQLVRLASALAQEARVLLLDEPSTYLDPGQRLRLWQRLEEARQERARSGQDLGLVLVTHDVNEALEHADQVLALDRGQVLRQGSVDILLEAGWTDRLYGVHWQALPVPGRRHPLLHALPSTAGARL